MGILSTIGSAASKLIGNKKALAVFGVAAFAVIMLTLLSMFPQPSFSGNIISKQQPQAAANVSGFVCGNSVCESGENCNICPEDCICRVQLKLGVILKREEFPLLGCSAKVQYSVVNTGNTDSNGVRLDAFLYAPHLNKVLGQLNPIIDLGNMPVNSSIKQGEFSIGYDCGSDIVQMNITATDSMLNKDVYSETWYRK